MKTKTVSSTRRSLRNATNGTKTENPRSVKAADQAKPSAKVKSKGGKGSPKPPPAKAVTPTSKHKREEEKAEDSKRKREEEKAEDSKRKREEEKAEDSKRKREEEKAEDSPGDTASPETEEVNQPSSNADQEEPPVQPKAKRARKKKVNRQAEELRWRTLDDFDDDKASDESKKKMTSPKGGDRRKQSLVERDIPCAVMVQSVLRGSREDDSDCEVLDGANSGEGAKNSRISSGSLNVDIDDVQSEGGSNFCEIIEESSSSLDFKKLHVLARRVHLPSTLWACHVDPVSHLVSFTRFSPDFSGSDCSLIDRAVVFKGSMRPFVFCNGEPTTLPDEINTFETLTDVTHALQHLNAMIVP